MGLTQNLSAAGYAVGHTLFLMLAAVRLGHVSQSMPVSVGRCELAFLRSFPRRDEYDIHRADREENGER